MAAYYIYSGAAGAGNGSSWANAFTSLYLASSFLTEANGDIFYIASDHNEAISSPSSTTNANIRLISVNRASGAMEPGAIIGVPYSGNDLQIDGKLYCYGINFKAGVNPGEGTNNKHIVLGSNAISGGYLMLDNCSFELVAGTSSRIKLGAITNTSGVEITLRNCVFKFNNTNNAIEFNASKVSLLGCRIDDSMIAPSYVFIPSDISAIADILASGCDFSHATTLFFWGGACKAIRMLFKNCLLPATYNSGTPPGPVSIEYELHACGTVADDHAYQYYYQGGAGVVIYNTGAYKTGGATFSDTDGTDDAMSLMMVSSAHAGKHYPLYSPWLNVLISSTGSKAISIDIAHELAGVLKDNEAWLEIEYMGDADNPLTTFALSAPVVSGSESLDMLAAGSDLTDTDAAWTGLTDEITHTLSKTITVNQQGFARVRVALAKASTTVYVDPQVTVS